MALYTYHPKVRLCSSSVAERRLEYQPLPLVERRRRMALVVWFKALTFPTHILHKPWFVGCTPAVVSRRQTLYPGGGGLRQHFTQVKNHPLSGITLRPWLRLLATHWRAIDFHLYGLRVRAWM